jgi:hypothetical protein
VTKFALLDWHGWRAARRFLDLDCVQQIADLMAKRRGAQGFLTDAENTRNW